MKYSEPRVTEISLEAKGVQQESSQDGPSRCSNSCCYYRDGATW